MDTAAMQAIFTGFAAKGIAPAEIDPEQNVRTFWAWKDQGRAVKKGEKGVQVATGFGARATVFHVSQTETEAERVARLSDTKPRTIMPAPKAALAPKPALALVDWSKRFPNENARQIAIRQSTVCPCGQPKDIGNMHCQACSARPVPKGWDKIEPGPEQTKPAKRPARKPATPQVPAIPGTAPLGIAPPAPPAKPAGKDAARRAAESTLAGAFNASGLSDAAPNAPNARPAGTAFRSPNCTVEPDGNGGKFVTFTMHAPKGHHAIGPEIDRNDAATY